MGLVALAKKTSRSLKSTRSKKSFGFVKPHESSLTANESVPMKEVEEDLLTVASEANNEVQEVREPSKSLSCHRKCKLSSRRKCETLNQDQRQGPRC